MLYIKVSIVILDKGKIKQRHVNTSLVIIWLSGPTRKVLLLCTSQFGRVWHFAFVAYDKLCCVCMDQVCLNVFFIWGRGQVLEAVKAVYLTLALM